MIDLKTLLKRTREVAPGAHNAEAPNDRKFLRAAHTALFNLASGEPELKSAVLPLDTGCNLGWPD